MAYMSAVRPMIFEFVLLETACGCRRLVLHSKPDQEIRVHLFDNRPVDWSSGAPIPEYVSYHTRIFRYYRILDNKTALFREVL